MTDLFVIRSPFQLICAIEAANYFKSKNNILVIIYTDNNKNSEQINETLTLFKWKNIIYINKKQSKKSKYLEYVKLLFKLRKIQFDKVFVGDFGNIQQMVIANIEGATPYLLDDGTFTINYHKNVFNPKIKKKQKQPSLIKRLRFMVLGLNTKVEYKINYFTVFKLSPHKNEQIITHDLPYFRKKYFQDKLNKIKEVYFLGMNLTQYKLMSDDEYVTLIKKIIKYYNGKKITYYPHRNETISERLKQLSSDYFILEKSTGPIEIRLILEGNQPAHIASFFSTALYTLSRIFKNSETTAFKINLSSLEKSEQDRISEIYTYLQQSQKITISKI